jgi:hypothetical protein
MQNLLTSVFLISVTVSASETYPINRTFPPKGISEWIITIDSCARYSIKAQSEQGTQLEILDKKKGVIATDGTIGQNDGRIDLFLDSGEYKIRSNALSKATGTLSITVSRFSELTKDPSQLVPEKLCTEQLKDLEQRSWWIYVPTDTVVYLEAQGRQLNEVALWYIGEWKLNCKTYRYTNKNYVEKPLRGFRIIDRLQKGFYRVSLYGGKYDGYTISDDKYPVYLKYGLRQLSNSATYHFAVSTSGINRYLLSPETQTVVLETPSKKTMYIDLARLSENSDITKFASDSIYSKSSTPRTKLTTNRDNSMLVVSISGQKNEPFTLTTIKASTYYNINSSSNYWVSSIHTGNPDDNIGASGFIINSKNSEIYKAMIDTISSKHTYKRKFNLLQNVSTYIWIDENGPYIFDNPESNASFQVKRFFVSNPPENYKDPVYFNGKFSANFDKGLYVVNISPISKGICRFSISRGGLLNAATSLFKSATNSDSKDDYTPVRSNLQFGEISLPEHAGIYINNQSPELGAIIVRQCPMDLTKNPVSFQCKPNDTISFSITCSSPSIIKMLSRQNTALQFSVDDIPYTGNAVAAGSHTVSFTNTSQIRVEATVETTPESIASASTIPFNATIKQFPDIKIGSPSYFDLSYNSSSPFQFTISEPGIYRIESVGRLATSIYIRDKLMQFVTSTSQKGVGRNAILVDYFLPGRYQIVIGTEGRSAGHLGVLVNKNSISKGGELDGTYEKRNVVPAYSAVSYEIPVKDKGSYTIESFGRKNTFNIRLEDSLGWPIVQHGTSTPLTLTLIPGDYRLISLPAISDARRIGKITRQKSDSKLKGKGPHQLQLNNPLSSEWVEQVKNDTIPTEFSIFIPASVEVSLAVTPGFKAVLTGTSQDTIKLNWTGTKKTRLSYGTYSIKIRPEKPRNHTPFEISVITTDLVSGISYDINKQRMFRVEIGEKGVYEFLSQGMMDVSAKLLAENAKDLLSENDDGYLDWNFSISRELQPGRYFLKVNSEETRFSHTTISMRSIRDTLYPTQNFGHSGSFSGAYNLQAKQIIIPLVFPEQTDIVSINIHGESQLACMLEMQNSQSSQIIGDKRGNIINLTAPVLKNKNYFLKIWSEDHLNENITLSCRAVIPEVTTLSQALKGLRGSSSESNSSSAWFKISMQNNGPSHFHVECDNQPIKRISSSDNIYKAFFEEQAAFVSVKDSVLYLETVFSGNGHYNVQLRPVVISPDNAFSAQMHKSTSRTFDVRCSPKTSSLIFINLNPGLPLGGVLSDSSNSLWNHDGFSIGKGQYFNENSCIVPVLADDYKKVSLWNASGTDISYARISLVNYDIKPSGEIPQGSYVWTKSGVHCIKLTLDNKHTRTMKVTLPPECGILYQSASNDRTFIYAHSDIKVATIEASNGGSIYLYRKNLSASVKIDNYINYNVTANLQLETGRTVQKLFTFDKSTLIPFTTSKSSKSKLFWNGCIQSAGIIDQYGILHESVPDGGTIFQNKGLLILNVENGWGKVSLCDAALSREQSLLCRWGESGSTEKSPDISGSSAINLNDGINWFKFKMHNAGHVQFTAPSPLISILLKNNKPIHYQEAWESFNWDLPLPEGNYAIGFKNIAGRSLSNVPLVTLFKEIPLLSERTPYHDNIGPGESKILSFKIASKSQYGIGIAMSNETADARIYDPNFKMIGTGKQQFVNLGPGIYYLWIRVPAASEGTEITTYLFGQEPPPNEPPEYLVKWIINGESGERPSSAPANSTKAPQIHWSDYDYGSSSNNYNNEESSGEEYNEEDSYEEGDGDSYNESSEENSYNENED